MITKTCKYKDCTGTYKAKNLCEQHYLKEHNLKNKTNPVRKKHKRLYQNKYAVSDRGAYSRLLYWAKKKKKICSITKEQYVELKSQPCSGCFGTIEPTGIGLVLIEQKKDYTLDNIKACCRVCQVRKPTENFDPITHSKKVLRRYWRRNPMAILALQKAKRVNGWECAKCHHIFPKGSWQLDHLEPVVSLDKITEDDLNTYARKLYCHSDNLQVLCKPHHKEKTKIENALRKLNKKR